MKGNGNVGLYWFSTPQAFLAQIGLLGPNAVTITINLLLIYYNQIVSIINNAKTDNNKKETKFWDDNLYE